MSWLGEDGQGSDSRRDISTVRASGILPFCPQWEGRKGIAEQEENRVLIVDRMARPKESWENVGHHYRMACGLESTSHAGKGQRARYRALGVILHSSGALWGACVLERADQRACIHAVQVYKIQTWLFCRGTSP